ncbi:thioredoxin-like protein [Nemania sp. FL0031]|nr:thioredoxin-like protein [Nemania sp. FL0031]
MTNFSITIVSDPVCPWCYIGKKRLDRAIALYKKVYPNGRDDTFTVTWKAYYLDPSAPTRRISWDERSLQKIVSSKSKPSSKDAPSINPTDQDKDAVQQLKHRLTKIGGQEGISFTFGGKIGNTRSAHRAIAFSKLPANTSNPSPSTNTGNANPIHDAFVTALFAAYFEGTADITSHAALADVAASAGLDRAQMLAWLDGEDGGEEADAEDRAAKDAGIRGVPYFTVEGRKVDGAQDVQDFMELFVEIKEEEQKKVDTESTLGVAVTA